MSDEDTASKKSGEPKINLTCVTPNKIPTLRKNDKDEKRDQYVHDIGPQIQDQWSHDKECKDHPDNQTSLPRIHVSLSLYPLVNNP
jgi:hypothetical protein